jgi:hypothetical protein
MPSLRTLVIKLQPSLGVLVVLSPVFLVSVVEEPIVQARSV